MRKIWIFFSSDKKAIVMIATCLHIMKFMYNVLMYKVLIMYIYAYYTKH